jgi:hypothetical protein
MKQAKIQLTADTRGFKRQIDDVKSMIKTLGEGEVSPQVGEKLRKIYSVQLGRSLKDVDRQIKGTQKTLEEMANASSKSFPAEKITQFTSKLNQLKDRYKEIKDLQDSLATGKLPEVPQQQGGGTGSGIFGRAGRMLSLVAGGMGIMSAFSRREQMATGRLATRALTTDAETIEETSRLGFTPEERRQRAIQLARQTPSTGAELTNLTDLGEQLERAYGVEQGQFAESVGAARRAGVQDQAGMIRRTTGMASAAGLASPQIIELMQAQTSYLAEMSKGINIDSSSLTGFATALSTLPFFKSDPNRAFDAIRDMNKAFTGGDEFQRAQGIRAIGAAAPGSSASALEFRREMGLFGELDPATLKNLEKAGVDTRAMRVGGGEIVKNIFDEVMTTTKDQSPNDQLYQFMKRTGLSQGAAASIFGELKGGGGDMQKIEQQLREAAKDPQVAIQERLNDTYRNVDGSIKDLSAMMQRVLEGMATNIAEPMTKLALKIDDLITALGGNTEGIASGIGTAGVVGATALGTYGVMKGGGKALGKAATGVANATKSAGKFATTKAAPALAKAAPALKAGGKAVGRALPFVGLGMFAKDAYDIYEKYQNGEEITPKDWAILTTSGLAGAAGMFPGVGTAASLAISGASAGAEFLPEDFMQGTPAEGIPMSPEAAPTPTPAPSSATPFSSSGGENSGALMDNTSALRELASILRMGKGGGFQDRYPQNANFVNGRAGK